MNKVAKSLKDNLSDQLNLYKYVDRLTGDKKSLIINGKAEELAELDKHIEAVMCQILELEQSRVKLLEENNSKEPKLVDFIQKLDKKSASELLSIRDQLVTVMRNIQKLNNINKHLIDSSIKWIEHTISTIANIIAPESASYNAKGKLLNKSPYNVSLSALIHHEV